MKEKYIFELKPKDPRWQADGYKDDWPEGSIFERIIVRAESPEEARSTVDARLARLESKTSYIAREGRKGDKAHENIYTPWGYDVMTTCNKINNSGYEKDGETEILFPAELQNGDGAD